MLQADKRKMTKGWQRRTFEVSLKSIETNTSSEGMKSMIDTMKLMIRSTSKTSAKCSMMEGSKSIPKARYYDDNLD